MLSNENLNPPMIHSNFVIMFFEESGLDEVRSCVSELEYDDDVVDTTIRFTMDDILDVRFSRTKSTPCRFCDCGDTRFFILLLTKKFAKESNSNRYVSIVNWCGCLTYDASYTFRDFPTSQSAYEYLNEKMR